MLLVVAMLAFAAGCGGDDDEASGDGTTTEASGGAEGGTLVFAGASDPVVLDGSLVSDGESLRVIEQIFETLVGFKPGTTEPEPRLAESWEANDDGPEWTFQLQEGVTFHDGEPFNAEAVCFNFDRWYNFKGSFQNPSASYYWQTVFGGFAETDPESGAPADSLYKSCTATDENEVVLTLTKPSASFLPALSLPAFSIASPKALQEFGADEGTVDADGIFQPTGSYGTEHPTGTGPFKFESWTSDDRLVLAELRRLLGRAGEARQADLPADLRQRGAPAGAPERRDRGLRPRRAAGHPDDRGRREPADPGPAGVQRRLRGDQHLEAADGQDPKVRQAIAHGLDRQEVVDNFYSGRGEVAKEFMPPEVVGYADDVHRVRVRPGEGEAAPHRGRLTLPVPIEFWYPTDVSRPYMPDPKRNFEAFAASLKKAASR